MEQVLCACGCGRHRPKYDKRGRLRRYISNHQNRDKTKKQRSAAAMTLERVRPRVPWNKGKTYVFANKREYANKGSWNEAMRRLYPDMCMRCGWHEATCDTHHITPKSNGGKYSLDNGVLLCPNCHRLATLGLVSADELRRVKGEAPIVGEVI